jgi:hypothetical protein
MRPDRITLYAIAAAIATFFTGEPFAQSTGPNPGIATPAPAGRTSLTPGTSTTDAPRARTDPTGTQTPAPAATRPSATKGSTTNPPAGSTSGTTTGSAVGAAAIPGGVPAMGGITPNRAELSGSAFTKLDAGNRGYVTLDDVRQLDGFESAFRQSDQNGDGRLNASEFNAAWGLYTGNVR